MSYVAFDWRKSVDFSSQMILVICSKSYQPLSHIQLTGLKVTTISYSLFQFNTRKTSSHELGKKNFKKYSRWKFSFLWYEEVLLDLGGKLQQIALFGLGVLIILSRKHFGTSQVHQAHFYSKMDWPASDPSTKSQGSHSLAFLYWTMFDVMACEKAKNSTLPFAIPVHNILPCISGLYRLITISFLSVFWRNSYNLLTPSSSSCWCFLGKGQSIVEVGERMTLSIVS